MRLQSTLSVGFCCALASFSACAIAAPDAPASVAPAPSPAPAAGESGAVKAKAPRQDIIAIGEIRLDGRITAMTNVDSFDMSAVSFTTPAGKTIEFEAAKTKAIATKDVNVLPGDDPTRTVSRREIKLGMRISVIGKDGGSGKPLSARVVILNDFSSKYTRGGSETVSAPVAMLLGRAQKTFDSHDYEGAIRLYRQGITAGTQLNDARGRAAALSGIANSYSELNQPQKAMEAFQQALKIREELDDDSGRAFVLNNMALLMRRNKQAAQAVAPLERAVTMISDESLDIQLVVRGNLANTYLELDQFGKAYGALKTVLPLARAKGDPQGIASTLIGLAISAFKTGKADEATKSLAEATQIADKLTDAEQRGAVLATFGEYYQAAGDKEQAKGYWNKAIQLFENAGNARSAAAIRAEILKLEAPATEAPATEAPATEAPATEAPATEAPATEAPATEAPATEAPAAEDGAK